MALKIKIKKNTLVRKIDGVKKTGYYGKVIANGTKSFEDIVKRFALKGSQLGLEVNVPDMLIPLREQLANGLKRFSENDMPWYHTFYLIKTIKPGETWLNDDGTPYREVTEPEVVVIKAD